MLATLLSATLLGLDGRLIRVEVDVAPGLPGFTIVGLADAALRESRERVRGAIRNAGFAYPPRRITVNLAPAELRKFGASVDLAIAIGILLGSEQFLPAAGRAALIGELSLGGAVRGVPGVLPMVATLARRGVRSVIVPGEAVAEARLVDGVAIVGVATLAEAVDALRRRRSASRPARDQIRLGDDPTRDPNQGAASDLSLGREAAPDLADVRGQLEARRALEIALAGGHGLLMVGPPGCGKTLLARTIRGLLPPLGDEEALAATVVASVSGEVRLTTLVRAAPFRAPHHTASYAAIVGGGPRLSPGEVTLADHGVLFLDELPEFSRDVLEALRQPLEDGRVEISRVGRATSFPARFQLVAAMNPCPCGMAGATPGSCSCPTGVPERYVARISGPLRDRIDLTIHMARVPPAALVDRLEPEGSAPVAARIAAARSVQARRVPGLLNARVSGRVLRAACRLTPASRGRLVVLADMERLSGRGVDRLLRVARTIADLAESEGVEAGHLDEAARYRSAAPAIPAIAS